MPGWRSNLVLVEGLEYGALLWLFAEFIIFPLMGLGVVFTHATRPLALTLGALIGHLIHGIILGAIAGRPVAERAPAKKEREYAEV